MSLTPMERYAEDIKNHPEIVDDESQRHALSHLQHVYIGLIAKQAKHSGAWRLFKRPTCVPGCYLYGDVGRGKTYLLDLFFKSLPFAKKKRTHFYRFMQTVHEQLKRYPKRKDPLKMVAKAFAKEAFVLCLDEFMVNDIADAIILGKLLEYMFAEGMTLVATSNIPPDQLYLEGLQRKSFLPAIALLEKNVEVINVDQGADYRRKMHVEKIYYYTPLLGQDDFMRAHFELSSSHMPENTGPISILGRKVDVISYGQALIWLEFNVICGLGRSNNDYLYLADHFQSVMVSNVKKMTEADNDMARRFIGLVDTLYDTNTRLIISSAVPINKLYSGRGLAFEFKRTKSRLVEMQGYHSDRIS